MRDTKLDTESKAVATVDTETMAQQHALAIRENVEYAIDAAQDIAQTASSYVSTFISTLWSGK